MKIRTVVDVNVDPQAWRVAYAVDDASDSDIAGWVQSDIVGAADEHFARAGSGAVTEITAGGIPRVRPDARTEALTYVMNLYRVHFSPGGGTPETSARYSGALGALLILTGEDPAELVKALDDAAFATDHRQGTPG